MVSVELYFLLALTRCAFSDKTKKSRLYATALLLPAARTGPTIKHVGSMPAARQWMLSLPGEHPFTAS